VEITFTEEALVAIAKQAMEKKTGARGLRSIMETAMLEVMYDVPSNPAVKEIVITPEVVNEGKEAVIVLHKQALAS
jgi:ATP-dependent Clp protease ATP-binding subunit ClpX